MPMISMRNIDDETGLLRNAKIFGIDEHHALFIAAAGNGEDFYLQVGPAQGNPDAIISMNTAQLRELRNVVVKLLDQQADFPGKYPLEAARKRIG